VSVDRDAATMAEQSKKATGVPLTNIAVLLALLGGVALYRLPLTSPRPGVEPARGSVGWSGQDVDARLWQDPLDASSKHRDTLLHADGASEYERHAEYDAHRIESVRRFLKAEESGDDSGGENHPEVLAVMVPGGAYEEYVERRLRTRHAVVEGLSAVGFVPDDYLHIGYFETDWPTDERGLSRVARGESLITSASARSLIVPYEWYRFEKPSGPRLLVLWLRADAFADLPLTRLAALLGSLRPSADSDGVSTAVIGPRTSNDLLTMRHEALRDWAAPVLNRVKVYSAFASASDEVLRASEVEIAMNDETPLATGVLGFEFTRTIAPDSKLMESMVTELERRRVWLGEPGRVVLLAELDTVYSRGLAGEFAEAVKRRGHPVDGWHIEKILYPEGIDGKVPVDHKDDKAPPPAAQPGKTDERPREATEGADQSDYLRRLAERLQKENGEDRWRGGPGISAVGVLGADVFDKIMILRALRKALPGAVFFTNNLDARLMDPGEWASTHNLVVASTYGLEPGEVLAMNGIEVPTDDARLNYPPFRDAYETSAFSATLAAVRGGASPNLPPPVRLYEIARSGAFRIPDPTIDGNRGDTTASPDARPSGVRWLGMAIALICLMFLLIWAKNMHDGTLTPTVAEDTSPRCKLKPPTRWEIATQTPLFLVIVCIPAVLLLFLVAEYLARYGGEPVSLFQGISIWPSEAIRLLVGLLGIHFCAKSVAAIDESNGELATVFHLNDPPEHGDEEKGRVVASTIWRQYLAAGSFAARVKRIRLPFVAYYAFGFALVGMMGMPRVPGRGEFDVLLNFVITVLFAVSVTIFLLFFVIDVMWLNRVMLINKLMDSPTRWPEKLLQQYRPGEGDSKIDACLSELLDVKLIAARTAVTGPLIYWPFLLLALMIVSRLHYFDDWDFPIALIVVFALNAAGAIFAALTLRQSAEYARRRALETLHKLLYEATISTEGKVAPDPRDRALAATARSAIEEVENLSTGAFGSFTQNPVVQAILLPGGASIIAAAQSLLQ
jgi:hypothetical protein